MTGAARRRGKGAIGSAPISTRLARQVRRNLSKLLIYADFGEEYRICPRPDAHGVKKEIAELESMAGARPVVGMAGRPVRGSPAR